MPELNTLPDGFAKPLLPILSGERDERPAMQGGKGLRASTDKGKLWFDWLVEDLSALILKGATENPPLNHSYYGDGS